MNPTTENNIKENIETQKPVAELQKSVEVSPPIKSEENQANWKAFREQREAERKAREQAEKQAAEERARAEAMKAALEALTNKAQPQQYEDVEESEEARIDKRVKQIIAEREAQAEQQRKQRESQELPQKLATTYTDFNKVCTTENLDYLEYHYPEVAAPYAHMPDSFEKWASIYKAVKRFVPNVDAQSDIKRVEKNLQKPGSISSPGVMQGTGVMPGARLTEERKAANWERMQRMLKGLN